MKVLVTGVCGQLGYDIVKELNKRGFTVVGSDLETKSTCACKYIQLDITDKSAVEKVFMACKPDVVIHCAAWTAVDAAEAEENQEKVHKVNVVGTENIALACKALYIKMMYISTDYVFDGQGNEPWQPDCKDYEPLNVYGKTKLEGEIVVVDNVEKYFIVRIAWLFGKNGNNFVKTMINVGRKHDKITVVCDQIGTPTYTRDLSRLLVDMIESDKYGYYHATNEGGYISWYDFTKEIFRQLVEIGYEEYGEDKIEVSFITTAEYGGANATRPCNSRLDKLKLVDNGFEPLPIWQDALARYLKEIGL